MKKYILLLTLGLCLSVGANAQKLNGTINISDLKIQEADDQVTITFKADIPRKMIGSNYTMVYSPVITDGNFKASLTPVIVQGRTATNVRKRQEMATGDNYSYDNAIYTRTGQSVTYSASVPTQRWMKGADLILENVLFGCCSSLHSDRKVLAENFDFQTETVEYVTVMREVEEERFIPQTLADTLMISFPFVANISEYDKNDPFRIYDDERHNALVVYYGVGSSTINPNYRGNKQILTNLTSVVSMIMGDRASEVEHIVVAGFSSPEGGYEANDRLSYERAISVKEHLIKTTGIADSKIQVIKGSVDWRGLALMISKTNIIERDEILRIIDEVPAWDSRIQRGRLGELMRLNNGTTYRYLKDEFFPSMRSGAFIKVYYKNINPNE